MAGHDLVRVFAQAGEPLAADLVTMLEEHCDHRTERRGCGYTQATRFLAEHINRPRDARLANELGIFANHPVEPIERLAAAAIAAGWAEGWRNLHRAPFSLRSALDADAARTLIDLRRTLHAIAELPLRLESRLLLGMMIDLLHGTDQRATTLPGMPEKPRIGSCSQAEEFFLEIAHGKIRRGGNVNVVLDDAGEPLLIEKMNLGESHSALALGTVCVNGVAIPAGALFALRHAESAASARRTHCGLVLTPRNIAEVRFLRLTTLTVAPDIRQRAFSAQVEAQVRFNMVSPLTTTLEHVRTFAHGVLRRAA